MLEQKQSDRFSPWLIRLNEKRRVEQPKRSWWWWVGGSKMKRHMRRKYVSGMII